MKTSDARGLTHDKLTELRVRGVAAVQSGESPEDVARVLGVHRATIYNWLSQYNAGGWSNLDAKKRGGRKRRLDPEAMAWTYKAITLNDPRQYNFTLALWTNKIVMELIHQRFDLALSKASVYRLLDQLGLSAQRHLWHACKQRPAMLNRWLDEDYPAIRAKARCHKSEIWFSNEANVRAVAHAGTAGVPYGLMPATSSMGARLGPSIIYAVNPRGHFRFMCTDRMANTDVFIDFLKRLIHNAPRRIFLIDINDHPMHKAEKVRNYVATVADKLELFFLPPHSPEFNQDQRAWSDLKYNSIGRKIVTDP